jgi:predicted nucleic acid-binding protein
VKILVDINVVLDVVLARREWLMESARLMDAAEKGVINGYVAGHTVTTVYYLVQRAGSRTTAGKAVRDLLRVFDVVAVERQDLIEAVASKITDFEDAVQAVCAAKIGAEAIATRDVKGFRTAAVPAQTPGAILGRMTP